MPKNQRLWGKPYKSRDKNTLHHDRHWHEV